MILEDLIIDSQKKKASDIHITENTKYSHRIDGKVSSIDTVITSEMFDEFCNAYEIKCGPEVTSFDAAISVKHVRMRVNFYQTIQGRQLALRILSDTIPKFDDLNLAPSVKKLITYKQGLVLITGVTGSGKTTTLASLIDLINQSRTDHIITIEQPVEYIFPAKNCVISQREVGKHTPSFDQATVDAMREDPDIVVLGEMRDLATMDNAITLAETGHLVFGTLHCRNAVEAVDRIVGVFPAIQQDAVRVKACNVIQCVVSQSLIRRKPAGRYCLQEVLYFSDSTRNLIRMEKPINQVRGAMPSNPDCVTIIDSAVRGIKDFGCDPFDIWTSMGIDDTEKDLFIRRCEAAGISPETLGQIKNMTGTDLASSMQEDAIKQAESKSIFDTMDEEEGWS